MSFITDEEIEHALDFLSRNANVAAKTRAQRLYLEHYSKSLKSLLMKEHLDLSGVAQEREAFSDPRYIEHLQGLAAAIEADEKMEFLRQAALTKIEAWRTCCATERAMKI